jgi:hypothetical protein
MEKGQKEKEDHKGNKENIESDHTNRERGERCREKKRKVENR